MSSTKTERMFLDQCHLQLDFSHCLSCLIIKNRIDSFFKHVTNAIFPRRRSLRPKILLWEKEQSISPNYQSMLCLPKWLWWVLAFFPLLTNHLQPNWLHLYSSSPGRKDLSNTQIRVISSVEPEILYAWKCSEIWETTQNFL